MSGTGNDNNGKHNDDAAILVKGISRRDYFSIMALQGLLARGYDHDSINANAKLAVWYADELIRELDEV